MDTYGLADLLDLGFGRCEGSADWLTGMGPLALRASGFRLLIVECYLARWFLNWSHVGL